MIIIFKVPFAKMVFFFGSRNMKTLRKAFFGYISQKKKMIPEIYKKFIFLEINIKWLIGTPGGKL
ncbi:MAG: hypothetical protein WCB90_11690 [Methanosarcina sp.]